MKSIGMFNCRNVYSSHLNGVPEALTCSGKSAARGKRRGRSNDDSAKCLPAPAAVTEKEIADMLVRPDFEIAKGRRGFLQASLAALTLLLRPLRGAARTPTEVARKSLFRQDLPKVNLDGWDFEALEITFPAGVLSNPHFHPGFVIGNVLEGEFRTQLEGQPETVYKAGQMFFEPLASHHIVSGSASQTKPARILAIVFGEKGKQKTVPL